MSNDSMKTLAGAFVFGAFTLAVGCESVAILPRENIAERGSGDRRDDSYRDRVVERDSRRDEFVRRDEVIGTVQKVDERSREIRLRTDDGRNAIVRYDGSTRISDGDRDLRPESLRSGDEVSVRVGRDFGGELYADAIRVRNRRDSWLR